MSIRSLLGTLCTLRTLHAHSLCGLGARQVFSFATVLWEMACHRRPYEGFSPDIFRTAIANGVRPVSTRPRTQRQPSKYRLCHQRLAHIRPCPQALVTQPLPHKRWDPALVALMRSCWDADHQKRPEFREVVPQLTRLRDTETEVEASRSKWQLYMRAVYP